MVIFILENYMLRLLDLTNYPQNFKILKNLNQFMLIIVVNKWREKLMVFFTRMKMLPSKHNISEY